MNSPEFHISREGWFFLGGLTISTIFGLVGIYHPGLLFCAGGALVLDAGYGIYALGKGNRDSNNS